MKKKFKSKLVIPVVCDYDRWCKHWFDQLSSFYKNASKNDENWSFDARNKVIQGNDSLRIIFVTDRNNIDGIPSENVIRWDGRGKDVYDLYIEIEKKKIR